MKSPSKTHWKCLCWFWESFEGVTNDSGAPSYGQRGVSSPYVALWWAVDPALNTSISSGCCNRNPWVPDSNILIVMGSLEVGSDKTHEKNSIRFQINNVRQADTQTSPSARLNGIKRLEEGKKMKSSFNQALQTLTDSNRDLQNWRQKKLRCFRWHAHERGCESPLCSPSSAAAARRSHLSDFSGYSLFANHTDESQTRGYLKQIGKEL